MASLQVYMLRGLGLLSIGHVAFSVGGLRPLVLEGFGLKVGALGFRFGGLPSAGFGFRRGCCCRQISKGLRGGSPRLWDPPSPRSIEARRPKIEPVSPQPLKPEARKPAATATLKT